jgi:hypothetical protein
VRQGLPGHHGCFAVMHTGAPLPRNPRTHRARPRCAHARLCTAVLTGICLRSVCSCHAILSPPTSVDNVWRRCDPNRNHAVARTGFYFHGSDDEAIYAMFGPNQVNATTDTTERTLIIHLYWVAVPRALHHCDPIPYATLFLATKRLGSNKGVSGWVPGCLDEHAVAGGLHTQRLALLSFVWHPLAPLS